jgi:hypothetical protein
MLTSVTLHDTTLNYMLTNKGDWPDYIHANKINPYFQVLGITSSRRGIIYGVKNCLPFQSAAFFVHELAVCFILPCALIFCSSCAHIWQRNACKKKNRIRENSK